MPAGALVCCAYPLGYGPAAKLVIVAERLRELGERPVFLGSGIAHELASRSDAFGDVVHVEPGAAHARAMIASSRAVFSMMDRDHTEIAAELDKPFFVADSLAWMREPIPPLFQRSRRYWTQRFPITPASPALGIDVGPIVRPITRSPNPAGPQLVINLGGCELTTGWNEREAAYFDLVVQAILDSELATRYRGRSILLAGARCVQYLKQQVHERLPCVSVAHDEALGYLAGAQVVLTAPGLTTSLECFQLGVPTLFLPPQNWSQWCILKVFRDNGLAPIAVHWGDFASTGSPAAAPLEQRSASVRQVVRELSASRDVRSALCRSLRPGALDTLESLAERQHKWFDQLGSNGVEQIAKELIELT